MVPDLMDSWHPSLAQGASDKAEHARGGHDGGSRTRSSGGAHSTEAATRRVHPLASRVAIRNAADSLVRAVSGFFHVEPGVPISTRLSADFRRTRPEPGGQKA